MELHTYWKLSNLNNQDNILNQEEIIEIEESDLAFESDEEKPSINNKKRG